MTKCTIGFDFDHSCNKEATKKVSYSIKRFYGHENHVHYLCSGCEITEKSLPKQAFNLKVEPFIESGQQLSFQF